MYKLVRKPKIAVAYCFSFIAFRGLKLPVYRTSPNLKNDNVHKIKQMVPKSCTNFVES